MNWDAIGAIAELLGAVGVIASLVYLATQIRDGQRALRASSYQQLREDLYTTINSAVTTPGLSEVVASGMESFSQLAAHDAFQFTFWVTGVVHSYENAFYQNRMGMIDDDRWRMHGADLRNLLHTPGVSEWWRGGLTIGTSVTKVQFSPEFVALAEEILGEEAEGGGA